MTLGSAPLEGHYALDPPQANSTGSRGCSIGVDGSDDIERSCKLWLGEHYRIREGRAEKAPTANLVQIGRRSRAGASQRLFQAVVATTPSRRRSHAARQRILRRHLKNPEDDRSEPERPNDERRQRERRKEEIATEPERVDRQNRRTPAGSGSARDRKRRSDPRAWSRSIRRRETASSSSAKDATTKMLNPKMEPSLKCEAIDKDSARTETASAASFQRRDNMPLMACKAPPTKKYSAHSKKFCG